MKFTRLLFPILLVSFLFSCSKDDDITEPVEEVEETEEEIEEEEERDLEIENFIYSGMYIYYLYKDDIPELANDQFSTQSELDKFLTQYATPEELFYEGLISPEVDQFSFLVDDYIELENSFSGTSTTTGMNFALSYISSTSDEIVGIVRYVMPHTSAEEEGVERGFLFTKVDGKKLTDKNYQSLLAADTYTIHLAEITTAGIIDTGETITLSQKEYTENPIKIDTIINVDGRKVGYLMYNSFVDDFDDELNAVFAKFKAENITDLVLDLRYNGGGYVESAIDLASMITGQFEGKVFAKQQWNSFLQGIFQEEDAESLVDRFNGEIRTGEAINSLNLNEVYVIATGSSASASELILNGLEPYINVVHVGTTTVGKFQASVTLYDSPNFGRNAASKNHTYAVQPLVYKSTNAAGKSDYFNGLTPDIEVIEYVDEYAPLGDPTEPLLAAALDAITGKKRSYSRNEPAPVLVGESGDSRPDFQRMYIEKLPAVRQ